MRQHVQLLLATLLVLIGGYAGYQLLFGMDSGSNVVIQRARGEVLHTTSAGATSAVAVGDRIGLRDRLRVGDDSSATVGFGDETRLQLFARSSIQVLDIDGSGVRVELEEGRVQARVRPGSPGLGLSSRGRAVRAEDAEFEMAVDASGVVAARSIDGEIALEGFGATTQLAAGEGIRAAEDEPAVRLEEAQELLLQVAWPEGVVRAHEVAIQGRTGPFASVHLVAGETERTLRAGPDGQFRASVPLAEGSNSVLITATDPLSGETSSSKEVARDSTAPSVTRTEVIWGP